MQKMSIAALQKKQKTKISKYYILFCILLTFNMNLNKCYIFEKKKNNER